MRGFSQKKNTSAIWSMFISCHDHTKLRSCFSLQKEQQSEPQTHLWDSADGVSETYLNAAVFYVNITSCVCRCRRGWKWAWCLLQVQTSWCENDSVWMFLRQRWPAASVLPERLRLVRSCFCRLVHHQQLILLWRAKRRARAHTHTRHRSLPQTLIALSVSCSTVFFFGLFMITARACVSFEAFRIDWSTKHYCYGWNSWFWNHKGTPDGLCCLCIFIYWSYAASLQVAHCSKVMNVHSKKNPIRWLWWEHEHWFLPFRTLPPSVTQSRSLIQQHGSKPLVYSPQINTLDSTGETYCCSLMEHHLCGVSRQVCSPGLEWIQRSGRWSTVADASALCCCLQWEQTAESWNAADWTDDTENAIRLRFVLCTQDL